MRILAFFLLLLSSSLFAAPFLIANAPTPGDTCVYTDTAGAVSTSAVITDATLGRICKVDIANSPVGTNNIKLRLRLAGSTLWGDSVDVPFAFARPSAVAPPNGLQLVP